MGSTGPDTPSPPPTTPPPSPPPTTPPSPGTGPATDDARRRRTWLFYGCVGALCLLAVIVLTAAATAWYLKRQFTPDPIVPVELTVPEDQVLTEKIEILEQAGGDGSGDLKRGTGVVIDDRAQTPAPAERRSVEISERELNALLHKNTGLADKVAFELSEDTIAARTNVEIPDDFPVLGGKTVRLYVSMNAVIDGDRIELYVSDVSLGGLPLPNAWIGGIKGVDLVERYGQDGAFHAFVAGIDELRVEDDRIVLVPAE